MRLPFLLSVPHAGWKIPPEVEDICILSKKEVLMDGDEGASEIYCPLENKVAAFVTTDIARAIVDLNRAEDDFRKDGIIKTHTCWDVPVYRTEPSTALIETLIKKYYRPYHKKIESLASNVKLGIDAHTMAAFGPPVGPDQGKKRPLVCVSNANFTCPESWINSFAECLEDSLGLPVSINTPFLGGYIIRSYSKKIPWIQIEYSRVPFLDYEQKSNALLMALSKWLLFLVK
ncbi:N-formylglutamate amidohydrolase [Acidobacteriota bacterium]